MFWLAFLLLRPAIISTLWPGNESSGYLYPLLAVWLVVMAIYGWLLYRLQGCCYGVVYAALLFVLCALPRLAVLALHHYIPPTILPIICCMDSVLCGAILHRLPI